MTNLDITRLGDNNNYNNYLSNKNKGSNVDRKNNKSKRFITVPENCVLVKENKFSGEKVICKSGLRFRSPLYNYIGIFSLAVAELDTEPQTCMCASDHELVVDPCIRYRIIDVDKFLNNADDPLSLFTTKTYDIIRKLVRQYSYEELSNINIDLSDQEFKWIIQEYEEYKNRYGIFFEGIFLKSVKLPKSMQDDYEKTQEQKAENARKKAEMKNQKEVELMKAYIQQEVAKINNETRSEKITSLTNVLMQNGFSRDQAFQVISESMLLENTKDNHHVNIFMGADLYRNPDVNNIISGNVINNNYNDNQNPNYLIDDWSDVIDEDDYAPRQK